MENQHCKMRWDLSLAVLQGLQTQPGSMDATPPLAWRKQQLSGSQRTPQLGSLSLPPPASLLISSSWAQISHRGEGGDKHPSSVCWEEPRQTLPTEPGWGSTGPKMLEKDRLCPLNSTYSLL